MIVAKRWVTRSPPGCEPPQMEGHQSQTLEQEGVID